MRFLPSSLVLFMATTAIASSFTPLEWQQLVTHANPIFEGQRKHTTWIRDQNRNFIDDEIEARFSPGTKVDVIVDFNACLTPTQIRSVTSEFGSITSVPRLVTFALLEKVKFEDLPKLAARPEVAMIEWQEPLYPASDVSTRAIQARKSTTYSPNTAEDKLPIPPGVGGLGATQIAIIDSGVDDGQHESLPANRFLAGFNAIRFEDTNKNGKDDSCEPQLGNSICTDPNDEPADGSTNPDDDRGHGTSVAQLAMGSGTAGRTCSNPTPAHTTNCTGVAPGAKLIDVKVGDILGYDYDDVVEGVDWVGANASKFSIRVANLSLTGCSPDDGTSALAQQVNYLVALGVTVVVGHGNSTACTGLNPGDVHTGTPGSASFAITVAGTKDHDTISRNDDSNYTNFLRGPRKDFSTALPNLLALKPDLAAPAEDVVNADFNTVSVYSSGTGTSLASPHVAGAAAILRWTRGMPPDSVKDVLKRGADSQHNVAAYPVVDPKWDTDLGSGMLNVWSALALATTDIGFPSCVGAPSEPGKPCQLSAPNPFWLNTADLTTATAPKVGVANTIFAKVKNHGPAAATFLVNFGVYVFAAGNNQFFHIGTKQITLASGAMATVNQNWTPQASNHQCLQVSIAFGLDLNYDNNVTQRNLEVAPSVFRVQIENPFMEPARMEIVALSNRASWQCHVSDPIFDLDPFQDCPRQIEVTFNAPAGASVGERASCDVSVFATVRSAEQRVLVGGVTVETFVPKPCRMVGMVVDQNDKPIRNLRLRFTPTREFVSGFPRRQRSLLVRTDDEGIFQIQLKPFLPYEVIAQTITERRARLVVAPECGIRSLQLVLDETGFRQKLR